MDLVLQNASIMQVLRRDIFTTVAKFWETYRTEPSGEQTDKRRRMQLQHDVCSAFGYHGD